MSDYDKNKFFRRTKFYPTSRDGHPSPYYGTRPYSKSGPFVKHEREYNKDLSSTDRSSSESKEKVITQPTILLKAREPQTERSVSPKRPTKESETSQSTNTSTIDQTTTPTMSKSMKLIDDGTFLYDSINEYMQDSTDFLVVGILGLQGTGKSTILNLLTHSSLTSEKLDEIFEMPESENIIREFNDSVKILTDSTGDENKNEQTDNSTKGSVFQTQTCEQIQVGNYGTSGINLYVTNNRVLLLDSQPLLSAAALDETVQSDLKRTVAGEFLPMENTVEIQSLQLAAFMLSVCHIVIVVQDWFFDSNLVRFLQTAEMLKPSVPAGEDEFLEYFPHVMLLHNRATMQDFTPIQFNTMQELYRQLFSKSKLRLSSGMGLGAGSELIYGLSCDEDSDEPPLNLFLLPEYEDEKEANSNEDRYLGHPGFLELMKELRAQIHGVQRMPMFRAQLTERSWLHWAARVWDGLKKSTFFLEYSKLMP